MTVLVKREEQRMMLLSPSPALATDAGSTFGDALWLCCRRYVWFTFLLLSAPLIPLSPLKAGHVAEPSVLVIVLVFGVQLLVFPIPPVKQWLENRDPKRHIYGLEFVLFCYGSQKSIRLRRDTNGFYWLLTG